MHITSGINEFQGDISMAFMTAICLTRIKNPNQQQLVGSDGIKCQRMIFKIY